MASLREQYFKWYSLETVKTPQSHCPKKLLHAIYLLWSVLWCIWRRVWLLFPNRNWGDIGVTELHNLFSSHIFVVFLLVPVLHCKGTKGQSQLLYPSAFTWKYKEAQVIDAVLTSDAYAHISICSYNEMNLSCYMWDPIGSTEIQKVPHYFLSLSL